MHGISEPAAQVADQIKLFYAPVWIDEHGNRVFAIHWLAKSPEEAQSVLNNTPGTALMFVRYGLRPDGVMQVVAKFDPDKDKDGEFSLEVRNIPFQFPNNKTVFVLFAGPEFDEAERKLATESNS